MEKIKKTKDGYIKIETAEYEKLTSEIQSYKDEVSHLQQQVDILRKIVFGQKSEKTKYIANDGEQLSIFNEAETEESRKEREKEEAIAVQPHSRKKRRTHDELAKGLPVEEVVHTAEERVCDRCGADMEVIGKEFVRDELVYVRARVFVRKHYVEVLKCTACGSDAAKDELNDDIEASHIVKVNAPAPMIPHSFASPELLAHIVYEKYCNGMPLYRQEKDLQGHNVKISRATMANWIIYAADTWIMKIYAVMKEELLKGKVIHADETVVQVLKEPGRKAKTQSRMWVYCAGEIGRRSNILFEYQPTRHGDHAQKFLGEYSGALVCDGYDGYNKVNRVTRHGCWAHLRRRFNEAIPKDENLRKGSLAQKGFEYCNKLFEHERQCKEMSPEERHKYRQDREKPVVDAFFAWIETLNATGGSALSKARAYALGEKKYLMAYLDNPLVPISNNRAENAIRPFVVGRKQWLFSASVKGAKASAAFYSIAATAQANGLNIEKYFEHLFRTLPNGNANPKDLLPFSDEMVEKFSI